MIQGDRYDEWVCEACGRHCIKFTPRAEVHHFGEVPDCLACGHVYEPKPPFARVTKVDWEKRRITVTTETED